MLEILFNKREFRCVFFFFFFTAGKIPHGMVYIVLMADTGIQKEKISATLYYSLNVCEDRCSVPEVRQPILHYNWCLIIQVPSSFQQWSKILKKIWLASGLDRLDPDYISFCLTKKLRPDVRQSRA